MTAPRAGGRGFTLLELSIVLVLIAVVLSGGLVIMAAGIQSSQFNTTVRRMDEIEKALLDFAVANDRIPCPADLTLTQSSANYGLEAGAGSGSSITTGTGVCTGTGTGMAPQANFTAAAGAVEGGVPTRALRLPDDYMYDGWGRKFRYAADPTATVTGNLPDPVGFMPCGDPITVNDSTGAARSTEAIYAIISHGANGHGAYTSSGTVVNAGSVNASEQTNCHCNSSGAATGTYTATYLEMLPSIDSSNALDDFDDIVTFKEGWQMQRRNFSLATALPIARQCVYAVDSSYTLSDERIEKFNTNGVWLQTIGNGYSDPPGSGQFSGLSNVALDSYGDVWGIDSYPEYDKFSPSGTYLSRVSSPGSGSGFGGGGAFDAAIDASNNIWVAQQGNDRVVEYNSSGSTIQMFGGGGGLCPNTTNCSACTNTTSAANCAASVECGTPCTSTAYYGCYCSSGSGNGQFNFPRAIAIDHNANVWVVDQGNQRVQEFSSSGTWLQTIGSPSSTCSGCTSTTSCTCSAGYGIGWFNAPYAVAIDSSNNVWVLENGNNRAQQFNSSGSYLQMVGGGHANTCTTALTCRACTNTTSNATCVNTAVCGTACTSTSQWGCGCGYGSGNGLFEYPEFIAVDSKNNVWITDQDNHRVVEYNSSGSWLQNFGSQGTGNGQFEEIFGITVGR